MLCVHSVIETHNGGAREQVCTIESQNIRGIESCLLRVCEREKLVDTLDTGKHLYFVSDFGRAHIEMLCQCE